MTNQNDPGERTLLIGAAKVGLLHLEPTLARVLARPELPEEEAVELLLAAVTKHNYVPVAATELYREALRREYRRRRGEQVAAPPGLSIRILGPGCVSCNRLHTRLLELLSRLQLAAEIDLVQDLDEIWRAGVVNTPALIINQHLKSSGRLPTPAEIESWLRAEAPTGR